MANKEESKGLVGVTLKDWKRPEYWEPDTVTLFSALPSDMT